MKKRSFLISSLLALLALVLGPIIVQKGIHKEKDKSPDKQPIEYTTKYSMSIVPDKMTIPEKKERFKRLLIPATKHVFLELEQQYKSVSENIEKGENQTQIGNLKKEYRAETDKELLMALKPHPVSIVLAQAAIESSWGTSRFFTEANNVFGVWSFDPNESRVEAGEKRGGKIIWIKKYDNLEASVRDYYRVIGRGVAFKEFRKLRIETNDPFKLVVKLEKYSEKREEYGKELSSMIRYNKFTQFDEP
jgi:Bax protein